VIDIDARMQPRQAVLSQRSPSPPCAGSGSDSVLLTLAVHDGRGTRRMQSLDGTNSVSGIYKPTHHDTRSAGGLVQICPQGLHAVMAGWRLQQVRCQTQLLPPPVHVMQ
jgi:hypothetical protein